MLFYMLLAVPMALIWVGITDRIMLDGALVGYGLSLGVLVLLRPQRRKVNWRRLPDQLVALTIYIVELFWDIVLSGVDVARRVLSPDMRLKPGIIAVPTQDPLESPIIAALSADVITLTPGELVVELEDNRILYVHCLDVEATTATIDAEQARRIQLFGRIIGRSL
jgi:multisubunit Na+/H+ antiporter MnhE subunit